MTVIDFPQMVSTDHINAEYYFDRDVECVRTFFKRKFGFESDDFPKLSDAPRKYNLDVELEASGFTKIMEKDFNKAYDSGDFSAHLEEGDEDEDEEDSEEDEEGDEEESEDETIKEEDEDKDEEEVEAERKEGEGEKRRLKESSRFDSWLADAAAQLEKVVLEEGDDEVPLLVHPNETLPSVEGRAYESDEGEEVKENEEKEEEKKEKRPKKTKTATTGTRSIASVSSTIPPEEIKRRVQMELRRNKEKVKLRTKGRQSAVARGRKSNKETIGEYAGWDF